MIVIEQLTKTFGQRKIFSNTTLQFEDGKVYALVGSSGCGKTTLLNILAKLETYDSGKISYEGTDLREIKSRVFFRDYLGYLFQNFGLLESQTIQENLDLGLVGKKISKTERRALQKQAIETVGLGYLDLSQKIFELSGGEAQRVALAKIILKDPPLIFADEPTAALDPKTSEEIMKILLSLRKSERIIIIATHNPRIWELADEVVDIPSVANV
ncbi:ABC transporter ATP-binding protein [Streptococcus orisratti]|uniref:ABC transporter ATP-binding protein n=1 Tax=Streptococcus TaxID=1301 RepID=UPI000372E219|nr:ABC transporter ATP-binding protein [Streptococcus orisratti]MCI7676639.1 ABC transporter ATP-binding protein [Streptococcus orisratti]MDY4001263.1 ABC transporter ATP-binding protein [Streptococcus orisratti]MDY5636328.1 ABC transporter ATP-binding protein [Streptococcus orisratti]HEL2413441.1 ABC transporter ATP-binding protein [Streptococcus suis]